LPIKILRNLPIATSWEEINNVINFNDELRKEWNNIINEIIINNLKEIKYDNINIEKARIYFKELLDIYIK
jgi:hypothetical protein